MFPGSGWWGSVTVPEGETRFWKLGPLSLWATRGRHEWQLAVEPGDDPLDAGLEVGVETDREPGPGAKITRFGFRDPGESIEIGAITADRPLIVRPQPPFSLPPGQEVLLYVSSPLWLELHAGNPRTHLTSLPVFRPSDTWFGPDTLTGEVAYASRTTARLSIDNLPPRPQRAITRVRVVNPSTTPLLLERIRLPAPNLSLYDVGESHPYTQDVVLTRSADGDEATLELGLAPGEGKLLHEPRVETREGLFHRAFGSLIRGGGDRDD